MCKSGSADDTGTTASMPISLARPLADLEYLSALHSLATLKQQLRNVHLVATSADKASPKVNQLPRSPPYHLLLTVTNRRQAAQQPPLTHQAAEPLPRLLPYTEYVYPPRRASQSTYAQSLFLES